MKMLEGEKLRSKLDGQLYRVKEIQGKEVLLENKDGMSQAWFGKWDFEPFFEKVDLPEY
jgi:hypothetical protein